MFVVLDAPSQQRSPLTSCELGCQHFVRTSLVLTTVVLIRKKPSKVLLPKQSCLCCSKEIERCVLTNIAYCYFYTYVQLLHCKQNNGVSQSGGSFADGAVGLDAEPERGGGRRVALAGPRAARLLDASCRLERLLSGMVATARR